MAHLPTPRRLTLCSAAVLPKIQGMALDSSKLDALESLASGPNRVRNDQGEVQIDILQQLQAQIKISSMRLALAGPQGRRRFFRAAANKLQPPGVS